MTYEQAINKIFAEADTPIQGGSHQRKLREIVRYGTLAASSHNTQCWKFRVTETPRGAATITILPDFERRCPVVDPDDHHLYCSLGCAVENIVIAASAFGYNARVGSDKPPSEGITLDLTPCSQDITPLFEAIPKRQCTRTEYDGKSLSNDELEILCKAGTGNGVSLLLLTDDESIEMVLRHILKANAAQVSNSKFTKELKSWIRFSQYETVTLADGLNGKQLGRPFAPRWFAGMLFDLTFRPDSENQTIIKQVRSSSGIAIFVSERDDPSHWVEAGRCYERFALQATVLGIRNAMLNQPVEEADTRPLFARSLGLKNGARPDLVVRFGRASEVPRSLRRPVEDVLIV